MLKITYYLDVEAELAAALGYQSLEFCPEYNPTYLLGIAPGDTVATRLPLWTRQGEEILDFMIQFKPSVTFSDSANIVSVRVGHHDALDVDLTEHETAVIGLRYALIIAIIEQLKKDSSISKQHP